MLSLSLESVMTYSSDAILVNKHPSLSLPFASFQSDSTYLTLSSPSGFFQVASTRSPSIFTVRSCGAGISAMHTQKKIALKCKQISCSGPTQNISDILRLMSYLSLNLFLINSEDDNSNMPV